MEEQPMYHNCATPCSLCEGQKGVKTIYISFVFINYRNLNQHAAHYFLGLNVSLTLVSGDCNVGTQKMKIFNWYEVGIIVLT